MNMRSNIILLSQLLMIFISLVACGQSSEITENENEHSKNPYYSRTDTTKLMLSDEIWKKVLSEDLYEVSRHKDTERPFTGKYWDSETKGTYYCAACGFELFKSDAKFSSSCGWPSFYEQKNPKSIVFKQDNTYNMRRIEALCGRCNGHLGHLFDDGPEPTGKRYCMNSIALDFEPDSYLSSLNAEELDTIVLGGGCYWCVEAVYEELKGVVSVESGYSGGWIANPTYKQVCSGTTNHAEVVRIVYQKDVINFEDILKVFNEIISQLNKEKVYENPIVTKVEPLKVFYIAENYHQDYYKNNSEEGYCKMVIQPKLEKFEKVFKDRLK